MKAIQIADFHLNLPCV